MNERITITIDRNVYQKLKRKGFFGETYSQLVSRLLELAEAGSSLEVRDAKNG
jgi:predicted CopG family antitoxin